MDTTLFDYLFTKEMGAKVNQPISVFTVFGKNINGTYFETILSRKEEEITHRKIKLKTNNVDNIDIDCDNILLLKFGFVSGYTNSNCNYSMYDLLNYIELKQRIEIVMANGSFITGYVLAYPNSAGPYGMEIDLLTIDGQAISIDMYNVKTFNLVFDSYTYGKRLITNT